MYTEPRERSGSDYAGSTHTSKGDITKLVIGALAGAAVGSLISGAFTQKGIEIRQKVSDGGRNVASNVAEKVSDISGRVADKYESVKEGTSNLIEKGKQKIGLSKSDDEYTYPSDYRRTADYGLNPAYDYSYDDNETGSRSGVLIAVGIAAVAGALVWSLFTDKGKSTTRKIAKSTKNVASTLKEKTSDIVDGIAKTYDDVKEGAIELLEQHEINVSNAKTSYKSPQSSENW